jgi:spore maturation protein SpmA
LASIQIKELNLIIIIIFTICFVDTASRKDDTLDNIINDLDFTSTNTALNISAVLFSLLYLRYSLQKLAMRLGRS